jgi:hypothetical protein
MVCTTPSPRRAASVHKPTTLVEKVKRRLDIPLEHHSPAKRASPKGRYLQRASQDQNKVVDGSVTDVLWIAPTETTTWPRDTKDLFVIHRRKTVKLFRIVSGSQFTGGDLFNFCMTSRHFTVNEVAPKLSYNGVAIDNTMVLDDYPHGAVMILSGSAEIKKHSGKLWTCMCPFCEDMDGTQAAFSAYTTYRNKHIQTLRCKEPCQLFEEELLMGGKKSWGKDNDRKDYCKPWACPQGGVGEAQLDDRQETGGQGTDRGGVGEAQLDDRQETGGQGTDRGGDGPSVLARLSAGGDVPGAGRPVRQARQVQRDIEESESEEEDEDDEEGIPIVTQGPALTNLLMTPNGIANRRARRQAMQDNLERQYAEGYTLVMTAEDEELEKKMIIGPTMTTHNNKWMTAQIHAKPESLQEMIAGKMPTKLQDRQFVTSTWKAYKLGARAVIGTLSRYHQRQIHYADFLAFGQPQLVYPIDIVSLISKDLKTGNIKTFAYVAYKLIVQYQMEFAQKNQELFRPQVTNADQLPEMVLKKKLRKEAEAFRTECNNTIQAMNLVHPHRIFGAQQKEMTESRRDTQEQLQGQEVMDPSQIVPKYLADPEVKRLQSWMLQMAQDSQRVPSAHEMLLAGNTLLVRLLIMRGKRMELYRKLMREEYMDAQRAGIRMYHFSPSDTSENRPQRASNRSVYHLGGDLGDVVVETTEVDEEARPSSLEGVMVKIAHHKTSVAKGPAYIFLSLPDCMLMDAYDTLAMRYKRENNIIGDEGLKTPFFINSKGTTWGTTIDFGLFSKITGYSEFHTHLARKMFATWMVNQNNYQLRDHAAFAASHSTQVQTASYLGRNTQRLQALLADTVYTEAVHGDEEDMVRGRQMIRNPEYEQQRVEDLLSLDENRWRAAVERRRRDDIQVVPSPRRVITPDVVVSFLGLIVAVGQAGTLDRLLNQDKNILDTLLCGSSGLQNRRISSLLFAILDFCPQLEMAQVVLENINIYCQFLDPTSDLNKVERDYAKKLIEVLKKFQKSSDDFSAQEKNSLSIRLKDFLGPLNYENQYKYCMGNYRIKAILKKTMDSHFSKQKTILRMRDSRCAVGVTEAIRFMERRHASEQNLDILVADQMAAARRTEKPTSQVRVEQSSDDDEDLPIIDLPGASRGYTVRSGEITMRVPPNTPTKIWAGASSPKWTDEMKLELLRVWCLEVKNPLERAPTAGSKGPYNRQLNPVLNSGVVITVDGQDYELKSLIKSVDTLSQFMGGLGRKGLTGMYVCMYILNTINLIDFLQVRGTCRQGQGDWCM